MTVLGSEFDIDPRCDRRDESGPFDIIGDVHGCTDELIALMTELGYRVSLGDWAAGKPVDITPPRGRRLVFVGDLADRGPRSADSLRLVMTMVERGQALSVPGNHDAKLLRWLQGRTSMTLSHGLELTVAELERETQAFRDGARTFIEGLPLNLWLDGGALVVAHAGIRQDMFGRSSGNVRRFCLYGDTDGTGCDGLPIRYHWAAHYRGSSSIVYGHTPVPQPEWFNNSLCIDTGCCFGGKLTALRWPERQLVSVPSRLVYAPRRRPLGHPPLRPLDKL